MKKRTLLAVALSGALAIGAFASDMNNQQGMMMHHEHKMNMSGGGLTEAGNDAFGTIQEVIAQLNENPNTDWKKVNLEALRQHLLDMNDMTFHVEVISQKPIQNGLEAVVRPTTPRATIALEKVFKAHPYWLKKEAGWTMQVKKNGEQYILRTTSENPKDADKIRGLGYIGLMAYGMHHQAHHWAMATGQNPHAHHNNK